jgi:hypothetical protein
MWYSSVTKSAGEIFIESVLGDIQTWVLPAKNPTSLLAFITLEFDIKIS